MTTTVEIIGLHPVQADEPVHLLEIKVKDSEGIFEIIKFTQEVPNEPQDNWQVPYDEKILNTDGDDIVADGYDAEDKPDLWKGDVRLAFFFHYLDLSKPLKTPFGDIALPKETEIPDRLSIMEYEAP